MRMEQPNLNNGPENNKKVIGEKVLSKIKTALRIGGAAASISMIPMSDVSAQTSSPENKKNVIEVTDPNDPRLKAYNDSLYLYEQTPDFITSYNNNQTIDGFKTSESDLTDRFERLGSKKEESKTKYPLGYIPDGERDNRLGTSFKNIKPIGYYNVTGYNNSNYLGGKWALDAARKKYIPPVSSIIEDKVDRVALKKVFPLLTDKEIDEKIKNFQTNHPKFHKSKDPNNPNKDINLPSEEFVNEVSWYKPETVINEPSKYSLSAPFYKKPVLEVIYKSKDIKKDTTKSTLGSDLSNTNTEIKNTTTDNSLKYRIQGSNTMLQLGLDPTKEYTKEEIMRVATEKNLLKRLRINKNNVYLVE